MAVVVVVVVMVVLRVKGEGRMGGGFHIGVVSVGVDGLVVVLMVVWLRCLWCWWYCWCCTPTVLRPCIVTVLSFSCFLVQ